MNAYQINLIEITMVMFFNGTHLQKKEKKEKVQLSCCLRQQKT